MAPDYCSKCQLIIAEAYRVIAAEGKRVDQGQQPNNAKLNALQEQLRACCGS
jgi:hypothetical protein